jgi:hypothetical protein
VSDDGRTPGQIATSEGMKRLWRRRREAGALPPPLRLVTQTQPEDDIQKDVARKLTFLLLPPAYWFAMPLGHIQLTKQQGAKLKDIGARRGLPDLFIIYNKQVYGIELKAHGGRLSRTRLERNARGTLIEREGQDRTFPKLEAAGCRIAVCHSGDDVLDQLAAWEIPMRRTA